MKRLYLIVLLIAITVSGCSQKENEMGEMKDHPTLFMNAKDAWVGDIMGMADEDTIYLNYLYETDYNGPAYHPIHQFTTTDLLEYKDEGEILPFGSQLEDKDLAIGTGSFFRDKEGLYHCFYTGHNDRAAEFNMDKECIMHAVSQDNKAWTKLPEDTFYAPEGYDSNDFRDPFVFWNEEEMCYNMLVGARKTDKKGGFLATFVSDDLKTWKESKPFYDQDELYFLECPDVFLMNETYYLIFSWNNVTYYRISDSLHGPWEKPEIDTFDGNAFYAAKTVQFQGKRYLFGFINRKKGEDDFLDYTWAGSLCPYEIIQNEDKTLGVKIPSQYEEAYFTKKIKSKPKKAAGEVEIEKERITLSAEKEQMSAVNFGKLPETLLFTCNVTFKEGSKGAGFAFGAESDFLQAYGILLDAGSGSIHYDKRAIADRNTSIANNEVPFVFEYDKPYEIKVVIENEVIVVYVGNQRAFSNRIYAARDKEWGIFSIDGKAEFTDIQFKIPK